MSAVIRGNTLQGVRSLASTPARDAQRQVKVRAYRGITDSVGAMRALAVDGQSHPAIRRYAENVIRKVYPKDYLSELAAVYYDACRILRYTRDPAGHEYVQHPAVALASRMTDCDDQATFIRAVLGAMAARGMSVGNPVEFVVVGFDANARPGAQFTHVFARCFDTKTGQYLVMDPVAGPTTAQMLSKVKVFRSYQT